MSSNNNFRIRASNKTFDHFEEDKEREWTGPYHFIQGADTQFGMIDGRDKLNENPAWDKEVALCRIAIKAVNQMKPKPRFFVVCGDLLDAFPTNVKTRAMQEKDFKEVFSELDEDIPLVCVCGNHDIGNTPTKETIETYRSSFGDDYFSFWCGGVFFIVINSQFYYDGSLVPELVKEHDQWLDKQLLRIKSSGCKHAIIFQHIAWFLNTVEDEDNGIFSMPKGSRKTMLDKFNDAGVEAIFCGHYHRNAGGRYREMEQVVTSAIGAQLGNDKHGVRVVRVTENQIKHHYYALEDLPTTISFD